MSQQQPNYRSIQKSLFLIFLMLSIFTPLMASETPVPIPSDFLFQGKPIQPACILKLIIDEQVDLTNDPCQKYAGKNEGNDYPGSEKSFGYDVPDGGFPGLDEPPQGYIYYTYLGTIHFQNLEKPIYHLILCHYNTGGNGQYGSLEVIRYEYGKLHHIDTIDSGDRSDGRIYDANLKNNILTYKKKITINNLYALTSNESSFGVDIPPSCAATVGCVAVYSKGKVIKVEFDGLEGISSIEAYKDNCYTQFLVENTLEKGKFSFKIDELKDFNIKAYQKCKDSAKFSFDE